VSIDEGLTMLGTSQIVAFNSALAPTLIASSQAEAELAGGALTFNLSQASITSADGLDEVAARAELIASGAISQPGTGSAPADWVYAVYPSGIQVHGAVGVRIKLPSLHGSHDYVASYPRRVVLIGLDPQTLSLVPVGVGVIDPVTATLASAGALHLTRLDYIGISAMVGDGVLLGRYMNGAISIEALREALEVGP
jgi:hypothetical protein